MKEEELIQIQNIYFDNAVEILAKGEDIPSVGYMITWLGKENEILDTNSFKLELLADKTNGADNEGYAMIAINMIPDDEEILNQLMAIFPQLEKEVTQVITNGQKLFGLPYEDVISNVVKSILEINDINRNDVVAHTVKNLCKVTKAFAFMHVSEAYQIPLDDQNSQNRIECLMSSIEGYNFRRLIVAPIIRPPSENGGSISIGEKEEQMNYQAGGRFSSLLQPVD